MSDSPAPIQKKASDSVATGFSEAVGLQGSDVTGDVKVVRVVDAKGQRLNAEVRDDGSVNVRIEGKGIPGRLDEVPACKALVGHFPGRWAEPEKRPESQREDGVDVIARDLDSGKPLQFQVTRIDPDEKLWKDLGRTGVGEKEYLSVDDVADALQEAITKKLHRPQDGIILVLNGTQLPIGLPSVRASFIRRHGAWLRDDLRFTATWIVQPFIDDSWTFRLDEETR